ncbi:MAG: MBOAT family O-acyltransferase [Eubacteriales bacterium]|nr:MBOAT family O-acyltransferase [Eubacteriales bacterium]
MIFSSLFFLYVFLPVTLILYYVVPTKLKNTVLLLVSLIFYAWGEPVYIFLMIFSILFNYFSGIEIAFYREENRDKDAKICFWVTTVANLAILGFFKYYGFLIDNLNAILPFEIPYRQLALPIGISFYTFQTLSYVIDVYLGKVEVQKNLIHFGAYVTMFPQLIAGPIVKYSDVAAQLVSRKISLRRFGDGTAWFLRGLGKKVLFANNIGMVYDAIAALAPDQRSVITAWVGCAAYTFQIYYDFSGYSDMAIGLGKMFGFDFIKNFDYPYTSSSVTEFWRRWHISLGSWFREYVYIPLGGNRCSTLKNIRNIFVVWMLTGFWHGAAWNFIFWGLYYGILLFLEKYTLKSFLERVPLFVKHIYTMILVMIGWVFFSAPTMGSATTYLGNMIGIGGHGFIDSTGLYYLGSSAILFILMSLCAGPLVYRLFRHFALSGGSFKTTRVVLVYMGIFLLCTAYLVNATYNPFLYFRF